MFRVKVAAIAFASLVTLDVHAEGSRPYSPVTQARLENPEPRNWLMFRRTFDANGYSPLEKIHTRNVKRLAPAWSFATGLREGHQAPPIVNDGVMFITTPHNHVIALDARTGEQLWRYERELPEDLMQLHPTNRGVALWGERVYMATADAFLVALDARTGAVVWEQQIEDYAHGYYCTLAPLAVRGKILVGVSGGELGIRGFIAAFDAEGGELKWKTHTIPAPGEPGSETWPGETWKTGGVPVWVTGAYDPELGLTYWGAGNAGPWTGDTRPGDNLYANSTLALEVETGRIVAYHQYHWNDSWDWDEVSTPLLLDYERGGKKIRGLVHPGRNGYLWFLERTRDRIRFVDAQPFVRNDVITQLDPVTGRPEYDLTKKPAIGKPATFCPSLSGGKNWPPAVFSPKTRLLYIPANENLCATLNPKPAQYQPGGIYTGVELNIGSEDIDFVLHPDAKDHIGELQAWRIDGRPQRVWQHTFKQHLWGPLLVTGGDLVFAGGTNDRAFRAFDARTGDVLWEQRTSSGVVGVPTTYEVDGVQYVAVLSGWGVDAERIQQALNFKSPPNEQVTVPQGGVLWVFALKQ